MRRKAERWEPTLQAWLEHEERLERWKSLPPSTRQDAVEQLARMMLRSVAEGDADETRELGPAGTS